MLQQYPKQNEFYIGTPESLADLEDFFYCMITRSLKSGCNYRAMFRLAHYFQVEHTMKLCERSIVLELSPDNFIDALNLAIRYEVAELFRFLKDYCKLHYTMLSRMKVLDSLDYCTRMLLKPQ